MRKARNATALLLLALLLVSAPQAGILRVMNYNVANNPDDAREDASFEVILEAVANEEVNGIAKRVDLIALAETDTGSSARLGDFRILSYRANWRDKNVPLR